MKYFQALLNIHTTLVVFHSFFHTLCLLSKVLVKLFPSGDILTHMALRELKITLHPNAKISLFSNKTTPLVCGNTQELSIPISVKNGFGEEIIIMKNLLKKTLLTRTLSSWEFFLKHWIEFSLHLLCLIDILQPPLPSSCKCIIASEKIYFHQTAFKLIFDCEEIGLVAFLQFFPLERQQ